MTIDAKILMAMRRAAGGAVSGADLSSELGISRAAIWARIEELRSLGYEIEASPHQGYRLLHVPDVLHADDMLSLVSENRVIGRDIQVFQETGSTNEIVDRMARGGVKEGVVVFAEAQTKGRGRLGRSWVSPAGKGLWFSVLLRPKLRPQAATQLTVAAATALSRGLERHAGLRTQIKWPNDILAGGKKIAGVLTELSAELDCIKHVVLGIGLNVNLTATDLGELRKTATSLKIETGRAFRRADLAASLLRELDQDYALVCEHQFTKLSEQWESRCSTLGHRVSIRVGDRTVEGLAESLDEDGALLVRKQHGHLERIIGGDVTLEK
jgi:BirA family transcriptional regulator, biotin operon repressor / biotin---[acetyl-CoA-carboxylase] ligase